MYRVLATNSLSIKEKGLDGKNNEISVIVLDSDLKQGIEKFYAFRWGQYYDPTNEFKPNIAGNSRIKGELVTEFMNLLPAAQKELERIKSDMKIGNKDTSAEKFELEKIIVNLRTEIEQKNTTLTANNSKIRLLTEKLDELNAAPKTSGQAEQLSALIAQTQKTLEIAQTMQPKTITIRVGEKENSMKKTVLHHEFETILSYIANGINVYMYGPAGTGKSTIGEKVAEALGRKFMPESALRDDIKITGYKDSNGVYHESTFYTAMKEGYLYMIDEIDNSHADVLTVINTAIAQKYFIFPNGELVRAHKDFMVIVAGNTTGDGGDGMYIRNIIDAASSDRFIQIEIDYDIEVEKAITGDNMELIEFCHEYRKSVEMMDGVNSLFTYRGLSHISKMENILPLEKVMKHALIKGTASDDMRMIARNINISASNKYLKALRKAV